MRVRHHKTSPRLIAVAERKLKALEMRKAGATYAAIARQLGFKNRSRAFEAVTRAVRALVRDAATEVMILELERLDRMLFGVWEKARSGNLKGIDRALKIMDRRRALYGLDKLPPAEPPGAERPLAADVAARILGAAASGNGKAGEGGQGPVGAPPCTAG